MSDDEECQKPVLDHGSEYIESKMNSTVFKPKYSKLELRSLLKSKFTKNRNRSIQEYDKILFEFIKYHRSNLSLKPSFQCIESVHPLQELSKKDTVLTVTEKKELDALTQLLKRKFVGTLTDEYNQFKAFVKLINGLLSKYNLVRLENYTYRTKGRALVLRALDLVKLNKNFITLDGLWLTSLSSHQPFESIISVKTKQYAHLLINQVMETYQYVLTLCNEEITEESKYKGKLIILKRLSLFERFFDKNNLLKKLLERISNLETAYVYFEKNFIKDTLDYNFNLNSRTFHFYESY